MLKMPPRSALGSCMRAGGAGELHRRQHVHRDAGRADRVALGLEPAGAVDRQPAVAAVQPSSTARAPLPSAVRPIASYSISSAMVKQSCVSTKDEVGRRAERRPATSARRQASRAALEAGDVAAAHRQEVVAPARRRGSATALFMASAVSASVRISAAAPSETSEQSVRLSGAGDEGVLLAHGAAEVEAEVLAHLRVGVVDAVAVVLRGDARPARRTGRRSAGNRRSAMRPKTPAKPPRYRPPPCGRRR